MSIRTTDTRHVALFDSTSDMAFGPVFESEEHADDYLAFARQWAEDEGLSQQDPAQWPPGIHDECRELWADAHTDPETGELLEEEELANRG